MNTTELNAPFSLDLARRFNWPIVTRDGRKARMICADAIGQPVVALVKANSSGEELAHKYHANGMWASSAPDAIDLLLGLDPADPAYRAAVQAAHEAGEKLAQRMNGSEVWHYTPSPIWAWNHSVYRLAQHCPAPILWIGEGGNNTKVRGYAGSAVEELSNHHIRTTRDLPAEPVARPLRCEEIPMSAVLRKGPVAARHSIASITAGAVHILLVGETRISFHELARDGWEISTDGERTFRPCTAEASK